MEYRSGQVSPMSKSRSSTPTTMGSTFSPSLPSSYRKGPSPRQPGREKFSSQSTGMGAPSPSLVQFSYSNQTAIHGHLNIFSVLRVLLVAANVSGLVVTAIRTASPHPPSLQAIVLRFLFVCCLFFLASLEESLHARRCAKSYSNDLLAL